MYAMLIKKKLLKVLYDSVIPIRDNIDQTVKNDVFSKINVYIANPPIITHDNEVAEQASQIIRIKDGRVI